MYNPYYYLSKAEKQKLIRRQRSRESRRAELRCSLATMSETRSMRESMSQYEGIPPAAAAIPATSNATTTTAMTMTMTSTSSSSVAAAAAAATTSSSGSPKRGPQPHPGTPWVPYSQHKFRDEVPSREVSPECPFHSTLWKSTTTTTKARKASPSRISTASEWESGSLSLPKPKYSDPGFNHRNGSFSYATHAYNLRVREKAKEITQAPWKTKGERTERERVEGELAKYYGATLVVLPPLATTPATKDSEDVGPRMATTFPRLGRYFQRSLACTGSQLSSEPYRDVPHPHTALYVTQFRPREVDKEVKLKDPVQQRVGFRSRVHGCDTFEKFEWRPL